MLKQVQHDDYQLMVFNNCQTCPEGSGFRSLEIHQTRFDYRKIWGYVTYPMDCIQKRLTTSQIKSPPHLSKGLF